MTEQGCKDAVKALIMARTTQIMITFTALGKEDVSRQRGKQATEIAKEAKMWREVIERMEAKPQEDENDIAESEKSGERNEE